jgi:hypothetical protein
MIEKLYKITFKPGWIVVREEDLETTKKRFSNIDKIEEVIDDNMCEKGE